MDFVRAKSRKLEGEASDIVCRGRRKLAAEKVSNVGRGCMGDGEKWSRRKGIGYAATSGGLEKGGRGETAFVVCSHEFG